VDATYLQKPKRWNISFIQRFMLLFGPLSSIYDFLTFFILLRVFHASETLFHTGWFIESLATQTLVIFVIRTAGNPFKSGASLALTLSVPLCVAAGLALTLAAS
jgi:P-type Mg2+ transporter